MCSSNTDNNDIKNQKNDSGDSWTATLQIEITHDFR